MEAYQHPFLAANGTGRRDARPESPLEVAGQGVVLSSLRGRGEWLELRLVCESPEPRAGVVSGGLTAARDADLLGRPGVALPLDDGNLRLELSPWEIRTVQILRG
jgi:mannosylglycerate hydrolase